MSKLNEHFKKLQRQATDYLCGNVDKDTFVNDMIEGLDGPDQRAAQSEERDVLHQPETKAELINALSHCPVNTDARIRFRIGYKVYSGIFVFKGASVDDELIIDLER